MANSRWMTWSWRSLAIRSRSDSHRQHRVDQSVDTIAALDDLLVADLHLAQQLTQALLRQRSPLRSDGAVGPRPRLCGHRLILTIGTAPEG
jgi:hypothetical protein